MRVEEKRNNSDLKVLLLQVETLLALNNLEFFPTLFSSFPPIDEIHFRDLFIQMIFTNQQQAHK